MQQTLMTMHLQGHNRLLCKSVYRQCSNFVTSRQSQTLLLLTFNQTVLVYRRTRVIIEYYIVCVNIQHLCKKVLIIHLLGCHCLVQHTGWWFPAFVTLCNIIAFPIQYDTAIVPSFDSKQKLQSIPYSIQAEEF